MHSAPVHRVGTASSLVAAAGYPSLLEARAARDSAAVVGIRSLAVVEPVVRTGPTAAVSAAVALVQLGTAKRLVHRERMGYCWVDIPEVPGAAVEREDRHILEALRVHLEAGQKTAVGRSESHSAQ